MNYPEQREYERSPSDIAVTIHQRGKMIPATIIDISRRGIGLLSEERILLGSKIQTTFTHTEGYAIGGTAEWAMLISAEKKFHYRTGIRADKFLDPKDILGNAYS